MTYKAAVSGILSGGFTVLLWKQLNGGIFDLYEIVPGFIISSFFILMISFLDSPPSEDVTREFESVSEMDI